MCDDLRALSNDTGIVYNPSIDSVPEQAIISTLATSCDVLTCDNSVTSATGLANNVRSNAIAFGAVEDRNKYYLKISDDGKLEFSEELLKKQEESIRELCRSIETAFGKMHPKCYCVTAETTYQLSRERGYVFAFTEREAEEKVRDHYTKKGYVIKQLIKTEEAKEECLGFYVSFFIK